MTPTSMLEDKSELHWITMKIVRQLACVVELVVARSRLVSPLDEGLLKRAPFSGSTPTSLLATDLNGSPSAPPEFSRLSSEL